MTFIEAYRQTLKKGYDKIICTYDKVKSKYVYSPFSHVVSDSWKEDLTDLLINNLLNYCYEPKEIEAIYNPNFPKLKKYIDKAIRDRLNKKLKQEQQDGLCGELLIDLILRMENENNNLLLCRPKYQQLGAKAELKNYDLLLFREDKTNITLILGQVKTGTYDYCRQDIEKDLNEKYNEYYFGNAVCYIADKRILDSPSVALRNILDQINEIALATDDILMRNQKICEYIKINGIRVEIPCLLFYEACSVYDNANLKLLIEKEIKKVKGYFDVKNFNIYDFNFSINFYIFPAKSVAELRSSLMTYKKEVING